MISERNPHPKQNEGPTEAPSLSNQNVPSQHESHLPAPPSNDKNSQTENTLPEPPLRDQNELASPTSAESRTRKRLKLMKQETSEEVKHQPIDNNNSWMITNSGQITNLISELKCPLCLTDGLDVTLTGQHKGSSSEMLLLCPICNWSNSTFSSPTIAESGTHESNRAFEVNRRFALFTQEIGLGHASLQKFSNTFGIPVMHQKTYRKHDSQVSSAFVTKADDCLAKSRDAVKQAYAESNLSTDTSGPIDIMVTFDGTWQKRGFTSLYGVGVVIDILTGLIADYHLLSKYCHACEQNASVMSANDFDRWKATHQDCCQNHHESSKKMEQVAAEVMWQRSEDLGFKYTHMLADGDSQAFNAVNGMVYAVEKLDCINHAHKRMGTALRNIRKTDKTVGGRGQGKLTEAKCVTLQNYYRGAIISNLKKGQDAMRDAIWASFFHSISTDDEPHHFRCPPGEDSWCFWQQAIATGEEPLSHVEHPSSTYLCKDVAEKLVPVYHRFSSEPLLKRMMHGGTQNQNECFNSMIWSRCPKTMFFGKRRVKSAVSSAVLRFNEGSVSLLRVMDDLWLPPAQSAVERLSRMDEIKCKRADEAATVHARDQRHQHSLGARRELLAQAAQEGDQVYGPGIEYMDV